MYVYIYITWKVCMYNLSILYIICIYICKIYMHTSCIYLHALPPCQQIVLTANVIQTSRSEIMSWNMARTNTTYIQIPNTPKTSIIKVVEPSCKDGWPKLTPCFSLSVSATVHSGTMVLYCWHAPAPCIEIQKCDSMMPSFPHLITLGWSRT